MKINTVRKTVEPLTFFHDSLFHLQQSYINLRIPPLNLDPKQPPRLRLFRDQVKHWDRLHIILSLILLALLEKQKQ